MINVLGVNIMASIGLLILILVEIIVLASFGVWSYGIGLKHIGTGSLLSLSPFHFTNIPSLISASSLAVASYLGFDAITTLSEEAKNPLKDIPRAIIICVVFGGIMMIITGYLGVLAVPNWHTEVHNQAWLETALFQVSMLTGGKSFALFYSIGFIASMMVFNIVATAATARLLFGMGRDGMLNKKLFSAINSKWKTPHWNVVFIMIISFIIGNVAKINEIASLVNFGALLGFAILNLSLIWFYFANKKTLKQQYFRYLILPILGFTIIAWVFCGLDLLTHLMGGIWLIFGLIYLSWMRRQVK
jgi:amino acid transporter